jgi:hypothetical protein
MEEAQTLSSKQPYASDKFVLNDNLMQKQKQNLTSLSQEGDAGGQFTL